VVRPAERAEPATPRPGRRLRDRLSGARVRGDDPVADARRDVALDRLRNAVRDRGLDPLAEARVDAARLRAAGHVVEGSLEASVARFRQAHGEAQDFRERFGRALPEQERALDSARQAIERQLPRAAEVLEEMLVAEPGTSRQRVPLDGLREAATQRQAAHVRAGSYQRAQEAVTREAQVLTQGWTGSEQQQLARRVLVGNQWHLARVAARDPEMMRVLAKTAPGLASRTEHLAARSETDHQAEALRQSQRQTQAQTRSQGMWLGR
jgi:hypothetical protein